MYYLGIDWANDKHDLCLLDDQGTIVQTLTIAQDLVGFERLQSIVERYGVDQVWLNIERSDGLLVDWMLMRHWNLFLTPTYVVAHRRSRRAKSDPTDAYLLAHLLRLGDPECRRLSRPSPLVLHLRELVRAFDTTLAEQRRLANRLRYTLLQYFPVATRLFAHVESGICLTFLEHFPTPEAARALSLKTLQRFFKAHHYVYHERVLPIYALLQQPMPVATAPEGYIAQVQATVPLLQALRATKVRLEKQIVAVFNTHPEAAWWRSFPGTRGPLTPARLLAWIGDDRSRFPTAEALQATAGTAPVTRRSGKALNVEFRRACSHPLRRAADDLARQSVRHSVWARDYLTAQTSRGHGLPRAYRALANRWMKIVWTLWQRREPYVEAVHLAHRQRLSHAA